MKTFLCCGSGESRHPRVEYYRHKTMEWVCYEEWLPNLRVMVPHVVDSVLYDLVRRACIEFAKKTRLLTRHVCLELQDNVADYYPCLGEQEHILGVRLLSVNGNTYHALGHTPEWETCAYRFWFHPPDSLEIHPAPKARDKLALTVDACPRESSEQVDKLFYDHFFEGIMHYAVAQALLIPAPSDAPRPEPVNMSAYSLYMQSFTQAVQRAKLEQSRYFSHGIEQWRS